MPLYFSRGKPGGTPVTIFRVLTDVLTGYWSVENWLYAKTLPVLISYECESVRREEARSQLLAAYHGRLRCPRMMQGGLANSMATSCPLPPWHGAPSVADTEGVQLRRTAEMGRSYQRTTLTKSMLRGFTQDFERGDLPCKIGSSLIFLEVYLNKCDQRKQCH